MKPLLCLLLSLCGIAPISAQSATSTATGLMTVEEYEQNNNKAKTIVDDLSLLKVKFPTIKDNKGRLKRARDSISYTNWNTVMGESRVTRITPKEAESELVDLFKTNGLQKDIENLPHWKNRLSDLFQRKSIVIVACDKIYDFEKRNQFLPDKRTPRDKTAAASTFNPSYQILYVAFDNMAKKRRTCFKQTSKNNNYDLRTTLAHEMGHQYVIFHYPDLMQNMNKLTPQQRDDFEWVSFVAHEAFAVYTEYKYLRKLAKDKTIAQFTIVDFINDAKHQTNVYGVTPEYMRCFIQGLDYTKFTKDGNGKIDDVEFNYGFLVDSENLCKRIYNGSPVPDADFKYKLVLQNAIYDTNGKELV